MNSGLPAGELLPDLHTSSTLRSRLMEFHPPEYDISSFREIVVKLAADRYRLSREIADEIAL